MFALGMSSFSATIGLVVIFFVAFPLLAHGLIGLAVAQVLGERAQNQEYAASLTSGVNAGGSAAKQTTDTGDADYV